MAGPATLFQSGNHAGRPASGAGCVLYSCTDHDIIYVDDGSAWSTFVDLSVIAGGGSSAFAGVVARVAADTVVANNTWTKVALATETLDTLNQFASSTFTATASKRLRVEAMVAWRNSTNAGVRYAQIYKNGAGHGMIHGANAGGASDGDPTANLTELVDVVNTNTIELYVYQSTGGNLNVSGGVLIIEVGD